MGGGGAGRWAQPPPRAGGRATTSTCSSSRRMSHRRPIWEHCYVECSAVRREWGSGGARASRRSSRRRSWRAPRAWTLHAASARWTFKKNVNPAPVRAAGCAQRRVGGRVKRVSFGASRSGRRGQVKSRLPFTHTRGGGARGVARHLRRCGEGPEMSSRGRHRAHQAATGTRRDGGSGRFWPQRDASRCSLRCFF